MAKWLSRPHPQHGDQRRQGQDEADRDRDTVRIDVKDDRSFYFSNTASKKTLMKWCS